MGPPQTAAMDTAQKSFTYYGDLKKRLLVAEALKAEYEKVMSPTNHGGTLLIRNSATLGPYRRTTPRALYKSLGGGGCL